MPERSDWQSTKAAQAIGKIKKIELHTGIRHVARGGTHFSFRATDADFAAPFQTALRVDTV